MFAVHRRTSSAASLVIGVDGRFLQDKFHGIGRYAYGLLSGLSKLDGDHRVIVFLDPRLPNSRFPLERLACTGKMEFQHLTLPLYGIKELWGWPRALKGLSLHVFHSPYFWSPLVLPCPLVATMHDMIFDRYPQYIPGMRYTLPYRMSSRIMMGRARRVIADSEATRRDIIHFARISADKIVTIPLGVDASFRPVEQAERARVRAAYDLPPSYILVLGARRPHKNIPALVAAFRRIKDQVSQSLVLVGAIDTRFTDRAAADIAVLKEEGRLREIAHVAEADLPAVYAMADLFVQPSIIEGFGFPVLEAMACGCPVACSNTSSLPEVAGSAALLFNPRDETDMAGTMRQALVSAPLREDLRRRGLQQAQAFSWENTAAQTLAVYRELKR